MELALLRTLTPAECLVLGEGSAVSMRDILKLTLMDLVLEKVLLFGSRDVQSDPRDPVRKTTYIYAGPNYKTYKPRKYEYLFLQPFEYNGEARFFLRTYVKIVVQEAGDQDRFLRKFIRASPEISENLERSFLNGFFSKLKLNTIGKECSKRLEQELGSLEKQMPELIKFENREKLSDVTQMLGANIFLIQNTNPVLMHEIDAVLHKVIQQAKNKSSDPTSDSGFAMDYYWPDYSSYVALFDSGFDAATRHSGSGAGGCGGGGCSGCSGCSGCGGCGGCGG